MTVFGEDYRTIGLLIKVSNLTGGRVMGSIDIRHLREIIIKLTEIRTYLRITDRAGSI